MILQVWGMVAFVVSILGYFVGSSVVIIFEKYYCYQCFGDI